MSELEAQAAKQLRNIEEATGRSLAEFVAEVDAAGLDKHAAIIGLLKATHGIGHGNANLLATLIRRRGAEPEPDALLAEQYSGPKAHLREIYDELDALCRSLGEDVTVVVQKTGVSFRRRKLFVVVRAATRSQVELGLKLGEAPTSARVQVASGMCTHRSRLASVDEIDDELAGWLRRAYRIHAANRGGQPDAAA